MTPGRVTLTRNLLVYRHQPALLAVTLAAPLGMMVLFGFVFGGSLSGGEGEAYRAFMVPGMFVLVAAMGVIATASTANADLRAGITDRFRSLPISSVAVPHGLALAETIAGTVSLALMGGVGLLAGWRIEGGATDAALALLILIAARWALSWLGIAIGVTVRNEQMLQQIAPLIFGLVMLSNVFVPTQTMPVILRQIAEWNPVSSFVEAVRQLFGNAVPLPADAALPLQHPVATSLVWLGVLTLLSVPIVVRSYRS
ncbi:ABC transporter permease [Ruania zhangjianzhongii]|uniref:ABC transporter permease n=1 Tax=Ruania zhangjianzhongii TaxID=2603206 RepID=UPI0011CA03E2|nr:ABC transporter permease [Ruania zhangjianzhongii]